VSCKVTGHFGHNPQDTTAPMPKYTSRHFGLNFQAASYNTQQATCKISYHNCNTSYRCKEMGGATSHVCQSGARSVSKRLMPSTGRYAVIGCSLQVASSRTQAQYEGCKSCAILQDFLQVFSSSCDGGFIAATSTTHIPAATRRRG